MKIAYVTYELPPDSGKGGIGTYTLQVAKEMCRRKHEVHIFCASPYRNVDEINENVHIHRIKAQSVNQYNDNVAIIFSEVHHRVKFDLVESPEINANGLSIKKIFPDLPMVVRLHAPNALVELLKKKYIPLSAKARFFLGALRRGKWDLGYWRKYDRYKDRDFEFASLADYITTPSKQMKEWAIKEWKIPASNIKVIPNFFRPSSELLDLPPNDDKKTILFFGRLNPLKGIVNATKAVRLILTKYPDWVFKIVGDDGPDPFLKGSMRNWIVNQLRPFTNNICFEDGVNYDEIAKVFNDATIVLVPSLFESYSYVCAEAMAAGKSIIASKNGGIPDLLGMNNGMLIDPNSVKEIYNALDILISDKNFRKKIGENARSIIKKLESGLTAQEFEDFYLQCCNKA